MPTPLDGLKVIDLAQGWSGPLCAMMLGDLGAEVVKVEPPAGDFTRRLGPPLADGQSAPFLSLNRSKKGIVLDFVNEPGKEVVLRLAKRADVLIESFPPGEADRLGIGYEDLRAINPRLVYVTVTPFGQDGPYRNRPGSELVIQAMSGFWPWQGVQGEPPVTLGDDTAAEAAARDCLSGVMGALLYRERTGKGQRVDVSELGSIIGAQAYALGWDSDPDTPSPSIVDGERRPPEIGYQTKDLPVTFIFYISGYISNEAAWQKFFASVGRQDMVGDPRFLTIFARNTNREALREELEAAFKDKTAEEVLQRVYELGGIGVAFNTIESLARHPQVLANDLVVEVDHPTIGKFKGFGVPWMFHETPTHIHQAPPLLGQHTEEVLRGLGYTSHDIKALKMEKVV